MRRDLVRLCPAWEARRLGATSRDKLQPAPALALLLCSRRVTRMPTRSQPRYEIAMQSYFIRSRSQTAPEDNDWVLSIGNAITEQTESVLELSSTGRTDGRSARPPSHRDCAHPTLL